MPLTIFDPGRNCWRIAEAARAAVLVDGACYVARLDEALRLARHSILIIGWDFDGRIRLRPDAGDRCAPLGDMLHALVESRPELQIRILVWSVATLHGPSRSRSLVLGEPWQAHPRIQMRLDTEHPIYGAHHQKIVCIDGRLAFAGGIDLTVHRWDTTRHDADDPARRSPEGSPYGPVHDLQMVVDGAAARALSDLARQRWHHATGEHVEPARNGQGPWPPDLEPDFERVRVAIARAAPSWGDQPAIEEAAALTMDILSGARRSIYIETQYLVDFPVGDLLAGHLSDPDGPEIIILTAQSLPGVFERFAMGSNRDRLIRRIKQADHFDRLRIYYPVVPAPDGERDVLIHSKLIIVDDRLLRVGSSNISNRSVGLDTECDLALEAHSDRERRGIQHIRDRLLGEHLGVSPQGVSETVTSAGSLVRAIDRLNHNPRGLRPFDALATPGPTRPILATRLLDPRRPFEPLWFLRRRRSRSQRL